MYSKKTKESKMLSILLSLIVSVFFLSTSMAKKPTKVIKVKQIFITGNRSLQRSVSESPTPIDLIDYKELTQSSGTKQLNSELQAVIPSFEATSTPISDGTDTVAPARLRGLDPDHMLVLINGKRRYPSALMHVNATVGKGSAGVDLNAIPSSAIERIEVLRDGAAAQYGSDAIAGVINIILKKKQTSNNISILTGQSYSFDGEQISIRGNTFIPITKGFLTLTGEVNLKANTNRAGLDSRCQYQQSGFYPDDCNNQREADFNRANHRLGQNDSQNFYLWFNSEKDFKDFQIYSFGGASYRLSQGVGYYRRAADPRNRPNVYPDGFLPEIKPHVLDSFVSVGLKNTFLGWNADWNTQFGFNTFNFFVDNSINVSLGDSSPNSVDSGLLGFYQSIISAHFNKKMGKLFKQNLFWAVGFEGRKDQFKIQSGDEASWIDGGVDGGVTDQYGGTANPGIQVFPGFAPRNEVDESRFNLASYLEISSQVNKLFWQTALRGEYYTDFGNTLNGKIAALYDINKNTSIRSSVSTGFRAPSLHQQFFNATATFSDVNGDLVQSETLRNDSDVAKALGIPELKEEQSINFSIGGSYSTGKIKTSADLYYIKINDKVVLSRQFDRTADNLGRFLDPGTATGGAKFNTIQNIQFAVNGVDIQTYGADFTISHHTASFLQGSLTNQISMNLNKVEILNIKRPSLLSSNKNLLDRFGEFQIEKMLPQTTMRIKSTYAWDNWNLSLAFQYYGEFSTAETGNQPEKDQTYSGSLLTNIGASYNWKKELNVSFGVDNIFNVMTDKSINNFNGIFTYPRKTSPFGQIGGYYYAGLNYTF